MLIIYSDKIVLLDRIFSGYIKIKDDKIEKITEDISQEERKYLVDMTGQFVMPGMININSKSTNQIEDLDVIGKEQFFNKLKQIEYNYALSGVTTLFHAVNLTDENINDEEEKIKTKDIIEAIKQYDKFEISLIDNKTHLKFQINSVETLDSVKLLLDEKLLDFVSYDLLTNYKDNNRYKDQYMQNFLQSELDLTEDMAEKVVDRIRQLRDDSNIDELAYLIKYAHFRGVKVCTSEYNSANKIYEEFKDTTDMIKVDKENSSTDIKEDIYYKIISPTRLVETADENLKIDQMIIASDRSAGDLLACIKVVSQKIGVIKCIRMLTKNPADALGIEDRGQIKEGKKADIIAVKVENDIPVVTSMIKDGKFKFKFDV